MKKLVLSLLVLLMSATAFADEYHDLALDAASKFSQIGSPTCQKNNRSQMKITKATSRDNGPHIEAFYEVRSKTATYEIEIVDGMVTKVTVTGITGS